MRHEIPRRVFLALTGGALVAPRLAFAADEVPSMLDHILLGCNDLERGIAFVEEHTGVRAAFGGVHPGRGTENALISLGEPTRLELEPRRYLEIIAPDPAQTESKSSMALRLKELSEPRLVGWAAHPGDLQLFATKLRNAGVAFEGPTPGSRKRPDGRLLQWKTLNLKDDAAGLLPFFIEWSADSPHPSIDAPRGCHLDSFEILTPNPEALAKIAKQLSLAVPILKSERPQLRATIACAGKTFTLTS